MQVTPNLDYIKKLAGDNTEFEQKFIGILKDEFPQESQEYKDHILDQDFKKASEMVHKLKHKFNILSMTKAYAYAVSYEEELLREDAKGDLNFREYLRIITNYLKTL